ncbi:MULTISPECIES: hypothetical protein [unclassified Leisingera]|uniref:hypothetical protein n=1 Tax=unclassified Leisingera TaxID=2614906 RepID=UPI001FFC6F17|nr:MULTISPECIES: hypothetical protein [unclassified Leisingera]
MRLSELPKETKKLYGKRAYPHIKKFLERIRVLRFHRGRVPNEKWNATSWPTNTSTSKLIPAIGGKIMEIGAAFDILLTGTPVFRARRIEAGLLNAGSDFGAETTTFDAGLGAFVEFGDRDFIGREFLEAADKSCRTWGMRVTGGVA